MWSLDAQVSDSQLPHGVGSGLVISCYVNLQAGIVSGSGGQPGWQAEAARFRAGPVPSVGAILAAGGVKQLHGDPACVTATGCAGCGSMANPEAGSA